MHNIVVNYWLHIPVPSVCIINFLWRQVWGHRGHVTLSSFSSITSDQIERASGKAPMCSEWAAKSNDMQHDHPRLRYWPDQPWPDLDLRSTWILTIPKQKVYHSTRLYNLNTMLPILLLCDHFRRSYLLKTKPRDLGHCPDLWRHRLIWCFNFWYQSLRLVTPDTLVAYAKL